MASVPNQAIPVQRCDFVLRNGTIIDGTGRDRYKSDIAIKGERIAAIGELKLASASIEIDAGGLIIAPGFIDVHTHDDAALIARPEMTAKLTQGVTTVIGGNCGISAAPYSSAAEPPDLLRLVFKSKRFVAPSFDAYLRKVRDSQPAINAMFFTGHATLRMEVMGGNLDRCASDSEIAQMRELLAQSLEQGSLGLSTGLYYPPARAASTQEVIDIAAPLGIHRGIYVTHMRDEADQVMESLHESLLIGRTVGVPVIISHHKCMGRNNFGRSVETVGLLQEARRRQRVAWDVYPYTAGSTVLSEEMTKLALKTTISWCDPHPEFCGRDLTEVAKQLQCTAMEAIPKLQPAGAIYFNLDEADVTRIMCADGAMIGSDGLPEDSHPHPRLWGTFPRVLGRYVRDLHQLSLESAVHRMTGLSAETFGMQNRGRIKVGQYADLCVFDPDAINDSATFEDPIRAAVGIRYVFVNGLPALEDGMPTRTRNGKVLRKNDLAILPH
jgi:N-acyl-D-amino-acid deacylase